MIKKCKTQGKSQPADFSSGHVPASVVYGPVLSRRFGRSLGVSLSYENGISCGWRCPYCQLGGLEYLETPTYVSRKDLKIQLDQAQQRLGPTDVDVICISGSGEPLDHPDIANIFPDIYDCARALDATVVILSNGDALTDGLLADGVLTDECLVYFKWDVMSPTGAWRALTAKQQQQRIATLHAYPQLRIQAMAFRMAHKSPAWHQQRISAWCESVAELKPYEVHVMSLERDAPRFELGRYDAKQLEQIADQLRARSDARVTVY